MGFYEATDSGGAIGFQDFEMGSGGRMGSRGEIGFGVGRVQEVEWVLKL